jgi:hypothetical protein
MSFHAGYSNPAKSGSAVATSRFCSAAAILIFSFWSLVEKLLPQDVENLWIFCTKLTARYR